MFAICGRECTVFLLEVDLPTLDVRSMRGVVRLVQVALGIRGVILICLFFEKLHLYPGP